MSQSTFQWHSLVEAAGVDTWGRTFPASTFEYPGALAAEQAWNGYQITPDLVLNRRPGRKQWTYSIDCKEIECQLKARQSYEQQSGVASYRMAGKA